MHRGKGTHEMAKLGDSLPIKLIVIFEIIIPSKLVI